jgi:pimeloyl-ACP methyl ester carboxylesterase
MTIIAQMIADRLIMRPSRHALSTNGKRRETVPFRKGELEIWTQRTTASELDEPELFVLKFQGTAGRAERSTYHPMDYWSDLSAELWSVNPPGYGGSSGTASVRHLAAVGRAAYLELARRAKGRPIVVIGNSLGAVTALHLSANFPVAGLILRNPPPLRQLIVGRYGWWNLWVGALIIAQKVPREICAIRNSRRSTCPAVFLSSRRDETVPAPYQEKIYREYGGPYRLLRMENAEHADPLTLNEQREYGRHLEWLRSEAVATCQLLA